MSDNHCRFSNVYQNSTYIFKKLNVQEKSFDNFWRVERCAIKNFTIIILL